MSETSPSSRPARGKLLVKAISRISSGFLIFAAVIFLPAGSLAYMNGWLFIGTMACLMTVTLSYLLATDPDLLERRLRYREKQAIQKRIVGLSWLIVIPLYVLPGLGWRFGWSRVPLWAVLPATLLLVAGYGLFVLVMRTNSSASRIIEVADSQKVIDSGPYAVVRHPMYVSSIVIYLASPIVLGSWWALVPAVIFPFLMVLRIRNEEAFLRRELPGYEDYMKKVRWRLLPGLY